jgi:hypothetical protein
VQPGTDLLPLLQMPESFTSLQGAGPGFADAAAPVVAQLTQLRVLSWDWADGLTDTGLAQLAGLHVTSLHLFECGISEEVTEAADGDVYLSATPELVSTAGLARASICLQRRLFEQHSTAGCTQPGAAAVG